MNDGKRSYSTAEMLATKVDVVVIGTGAGGAPVLARLAEAGLAVVALEAGRVWCPEKEYAQDEVAQRSLYWLDERLSDGAVQLSLAKITADVEWEGRRFITVPLPHALMRAIFQSILSLVWVLIGPSPSRNFCRISSKRRNFSASRGLLVIRGIRIGNTGCLRCH
jgi:hypothetical protein